MKNFKIMICLIICIIFLLVSASSAHHLWIEKEGEKFVIAWGHPPKKDSYDPAKLKEIKVFDCKGKEVKVTRIDEKDKVLISPSTKNIAMITVSYEGGYLVVTPEGKKRMTKIEAHKAGLQVIDSFYSRQFAKSLFDYCKSVMNPTGMLFEIIPLKNPYSLKVGDTLPIKVLYQGKPISGAKIQVGVHKEVAKTDENGMATITLPEPIGGMQVVIANHRLPSNDPDADFISFTTVLTWETK